MEQRPPNRGSIGEDADAEDDDDPSCQLRANTNLIADIYDRGRNQDVGDERHDEDAIGEYAFQIGPEGAEQRVHRCDDRDWQIRLEDLGNRWLQDNADDDP